MLKRLVILVLLACIGATASLTIADTARAEERKKSGALTERTYKKLTVIHELIGEEKYAEALKLLAPLSERLSNDYEKAIVFQTYGFVYAAQNDYRRATDYLEKCLAVDALREDQTQRLVFNLAQLYIAQERFQEGIRTLENWFKTAESPDAHAYALLATAYAQGKQYRKAVPPLEKAISLSDDPKETWYKLLMAMHYELQNYPKVAEVLEVMTARWPENEKYWKQLATIYIQLKQESKALATLELAFRRGYLTREREIKQLANLHAYFDDPFEAAQVLEKGLADGLVEPTSKHYEMLGNYWMSAQENDRAIAALSRAGRDAQDGQIDLRVAYLQIEKEAWSEAEESLKLAVKKGGLKKPGQAYILLGMAAYETKRYPQAEEYFSKAAQYDDSRQDANQWLNHVASEQAILAAE